MNIKYDSNCDHLVSMDCADSEVFEDGYYFTRFAALPLVEHLFDVKTKQAYTKNEHSPIDKKYDITDFDVMFTVDDGPQIFAHRQTLASKSIYFGAMFSGFFVEATTSNVHIHGVSARALKKIVKFCYTNCIKFKKFDVKDIIAAANLMLFQDIVEEGRTYLENLLYPETCIDIYEFLQQYKFQAVAITYAQRYFLQVMKTKPFLNIPLEILIDFIDELRKRNHSPLELFDAVRKWIDFDESSRKPYVLDPNSSFIAYRVLNEVLICITSKAKDLTHIEKFDIKYIQKQFECEQKSFYSSKASEFIHFLIHANSVEVHCPVFDNYIGVLNFGNRFRAFRPITYFESNIICSGKCLFEDKIIMAGGRIAVEHFKGRIEVRNLKIEEKPLTNKVSYLSLQNLKVYNLPSMKIARESPSVAILDNAIYVCGGVIRENGKEVVSNCVERFDLAKKLWTSATPMLTKRVFFSLCVTGTNRMYAVGPPCCSYLSRWPDDCEELLIECFDSQKNEWNMIAKIQERSLCNSSFVFNNSLHTIFQFKRILKYDEHSNSWREVQKTFRYYYGNCPIIYEKENTLVVVGSLASKHGLYVEHTLWTKCRALILRKYDCRGNRFGRSTRYYNYPEMLETDTKCEMRTTISAQWENLQENDGQKRCIFLIATEITIPIVRQLATHAAVLVVRKSGNELPTSQNCNLLFTYYYHETSVMENSEWYAPVNFVKNVQQLSNYKVLHIFFGTQNGTKDCYIRSIDWIAKLIRHGVYNPQKLGIQDVMKVAYVINDISMMVDDYAIICEQTIIVDLKGLTLAQVPTATKFKEILQ